jgi:ubiquinone/menaquinone biosynthesis C-methylase UbiE
MEHVPETQAPATRGITIRWARFYDLMLAAGTLGREHAMRERLVDLAELREGERVLDVGCGTGTLTMSAKRRVGASGEVCGVDAAVEMVARARHKSAAAGLEIEFRAAVAESLPFVDASFDAVLTCLMLHHLPPDLREVALREMRRVLRPAGRLLVVEFAPPRDVLRRLFTRATFGGRMADYDLGGETARITAAAFEIARQGASGVPLLDFVLARPLPCSGRAAVIGPGNQPGRTVRARRRTGGRARGDRGGYSTALRNRRPPRTHP